MSSFYFFPQKVSVKLIQRGVLLHQASLHNEVIQTTYCAIPKMSTFPKERCFLPFLFVSVSKMVGGKFLVPLLGATGSEKQADVSLL